MNEQDKQRYKEALAEVRNQTIQECIDALPKKLTDRISAKTFDNVDEYNSGIERCVETLQALIK